MSVYFGAAAVHIDRGDRFQKFSLKRSIPLREPVKDDDENIVRDVVETDDMGKALYATVKEELRILKPVIDAIPEDKLELRISREPHPDHPTNPDLDTVSIRFCPNGQFQRNNPSYHGIAPDEFPPHAAAQLFSLLRNYSRKPYAGN